MKNTLIILISLCNLSIAQAQDSALLQSTQCKSGKSFIYKTDTLDFESPNLIRNILHVPNDLLQLAKAAFQKRNLVGLGVVTISSIALITKDNQIISWVRKTSDKIGLKPQSNFKVAWRVGNTKIIKVPQNVNTVLYQMGEGGTSMILAGGMWIYGKIKRDSRAISTAYDLAETFLTMGISTQILKRIIGRESPFLATEPGGRWRSFPSFKKFQQNTSAYDGFPSGHLATLMATVTVLSLNYPEKKWIRPIGYTLMGLSSWAMMNTEVHWAGDYPLAIAIGYLSGKITTWRNRPKNISPAKAILL